jgi:hypothetical protein
LGLHFLQQGVEECAALRERRIRARLDLEPSREDVVRSKSAIRCNQLDEIVDQSRRSDQEHRRNRHLEHHQAAAEPRAVGFFGAARAGLQTLAEVQCGHAQSRKHAHQDSRRDRRCERKQQRHAVQHWTVVLNLTQREQAQQQNLQRVGHTDAQGAREEREQHALGQQLPHQPASRSAERGAHRHFGNTLLSARQQQAGHIAAGNQQNQDAGRHQQQQTGSHACDHEGVQPGQPQRLSGIAHRVLPLQSLRQSIRLQLRLPQRDARFQTADQRVIMLVPGAAHRVVVANHEPQVGVDQEPESVRHHSDDFERLAVAMHRLAQGLPRSAEQVRGQGVAQDRPRRAGALGIFRRKVTAGSRGDSQSSKQIPRDEAGAYQFGFLPAGERARRGGVHKGREAFK